MKWFHTPANYNGSGLPERWHAYGRSGWCVEARGGRFLLRQEGTYVGTGDTLAEVQRQARDTERSARRRARG